LSIRYSIVKKNRRAQGAAGADPEQRGVLEAARHFFVTARHYLLYSSAFSFVMGWIILMRHLEDVHVIGRNLAVVMISLFYALLFGLFVCLPMEVKTKQKLLKLEE